MEPGGDRWIAATALRLGDPLVSDDRIFEGVPGLVLESVRTARGNAWLGGCCGVPAAVLGELLSQILGLTGPGLPSSQNSTAKQAGR
jgi:hypothetical protein